MKITLKGVRGSIPTSSPETKYYGGNTSCISVRENGQLLVLDGGSGMQQFTANDIPSTRRVDILLTHLHLDHIQGLGFFKPLFDPDTEVHIWGPASSSVSLHSRLSRYLSPPLFPVLIRDLPCKLILHEIGNSEFDIGHFRIQSAYVIHPGSTVGFRIMGEKSVFTYIPDHEPALGPKGIIEDPKWISGITLAAHADILYHDAQYTGKEYLDRKGWGHSSMEDALHFAHLAEVKQLLMGHHDPSHSDEKLNQLFEELKTAHSYQFQYQLAVEGMEIDI